MVEAEMDLQRERAGKNQSVFREVNERVEEIAKGFELEGHLIDFVCECAHADCAERLELTVDEYEEIRRVPTHFAIANGHEMPGVERVVDGLERYIVVAKIGRGGEVALRLNPRAPALS
jgi:hypothetical protein